MTALSADEERNWKILPMLTSRQVQLVPATMLAQSALTSDLLIERVVEIGRRNLASHRIRRVMVESGHYSTLSEEALDVYVARLVLYHLQEYQRLVALERSDATTWTELRAWLSRRAAAILQRWDTSDASAPDADDFAHDVCATLSTKLEQYPFDAPFDAWVTKILRSTIAARFTRSRDILDRRSDVASLNLPAQDDPTQPSLLVRWVADPRQFSQLEQLEARTLIVDALGQLESLDQRTVLIYTYFHDLPDVEIGRRIGKTVGNVAQLRFRGLRKLRHILGAG